MIREMDSTMDGDHGLDTVTGVVMIQSGNSAAVALKTALASDGELVVTAVNTITAPPTMINTWQVTR